MRRTFQDPAARRIWHDLSGCFWLAFIAWLLLSPRPSASAQHPVIATNLLRSDFWDTDGTIHAIVATNGVVYVGGSFSYVAPRGQKIAAIDAYTAEPILEFPDVTGGTVRAIISDDNGGWYLGGDFTEVGGLPRTNLVHVRSDFSVDPVFQPNPNGTVRALVMDGGTLYLGGNFTGIGGQIRSRLAALNAATGTVTPWNPVANDYVSALLLSGNTMYIGGRFTQAGGLPRSYLANVDLQTGTVLTWQAQLDGEVLTMGLLEDRIVIGGSFNVAGGADRNGLAAFDVNTAQVIADWNPNPRDGPLPGGKVTALRVVCNTVCVGGYFTTIGGANRARVASIDGFSGLATDWDAQLGLLRSSSLASSVQTIEVSGNTIFLGGEFNTANGQARRDLLAMDATSGQLLAWNPGIDGGVVALGIVGRTLLAAFATGPGGVERRNLAAFDEATGRALDWNPDSDDTVLALALSGNTLFAGGNFTHLGGLPRSRLAAVDVSSGTVLTNWTGNANSNVHTLAVSGNHLYAGGRFTAVNGTIQRRLAALDANTGQLIPGWAANAEGGFVQALAVDGSTLYAGGSFTQIGVASRNRIAALDASSGSVLSWNPGADDAVRALLVSAGTVYLGGRFTIAANQPRAGVAAFDTSSGLLRAWNPGGLTFDLQPDVRALADSGGAIYLGGSFLQLNGETRLGLGAVQADGTLLGWNPGASDQNVVNALHVSHQVVYAGGGGSLAFQSASSRRSLAAFPQIGAPMLTERPQDARVNQGGDVTFSVIGSGVGPLLHQWRFNGGNLPGQTNATLVRTNLQVADSGLYEVIVSNSLGTITAEASLVVLAPVQILVQPTPQIAATGSTVTLSVTASGNPSPIYQWRLNGVLIPGAVYPTLNLTNVTPRNGGSYSVAIANSSGALVSDTVAIAILSTALLLPDSFTNRGSISGISGTISGSNTGATREDAAVEPRHAGKRGGASIWLKWIAPANGIATFSTRGSGFDTLIGIYTNTTLAGLGEVTSDEDRGGFLTSRASFNAQTGVEYQIAIDGLGGATGNIVLTWETEAGAPDLPIITTPPLSQTVSFGGTAFFSASVADPTATQFQWFFGCQAIRDATNTTLTITNIRTRHVGFYHVVVVNPSGRVVESLPAALEIGPFPTARSFEKLEDLIDASGGEPAGLGAPDSITTAAAPGSTLFQISLGTPISHTFSTSTNSPALLSGDCGTISGGSVFLSFAPTQNGVVMVDTLGSSFDTVLSVFYYADPLHLASSLIECDNDSAPDGVRSLLRLEASSARQYLVRVSGVGSSRGRAQVNWRLGVPPAIIISNSHLNVRAGTNLLLDAGFLITNTIPTSYQWQLNGANLMEATNATFHFTNVNSSMAGSYSVIASNFAGVVTNLRANIEVKAPLSLGQMRWNADGKFSFAVTGSPRDSFVVEVSSDLTDAAQWTTIFSATLPDTAAAVVFTDADSPSTRVRFYRVRLLPSPANLRP